MSLHGSLEKATGTVRIYSVPVAFPTDSKRSKFGVGSLYKPYEFIGDSALLSGLGVIDVNKETISSGSYKHAQPDSTHLGSRQPNEVPVEVPAIAAATHHRPGVHSASPEASSFC